MPKPVADLLADLRADPSEGTLRNVISDLSEMDIRRFQTLANETNAVLRRQGPDRAREVERQILVVQDELSMFLDPAGDGPSLVGDLRGYTFGAKRRSQSSKFGSCVKAVRKTVKARKGSSAESAAIAICTKSMLHPRGRTIKRYRKGRLTTQKRRA
jgi:hypothetical protein